MNIISQGSINLCLCFAVESDTQVHGAKVFVWPRRALLALSLKDKLKKQEMQSRRDYIFTSFILATQSQPKNALAFLYL